MHCVFMRHDTTELPKILLLLSLLPSQKYAKGTMSCKYNIFVVGMVFISFLSLLFMLGTWADEKFLSAVFSGKFVNLLVLPKH